MSVTIDLKNELTYTELLPPASQTVTLNGAGVDLQKVAPQTAAVELHVGTVTGTTPTLNVKIQDSADNSTFADLATPIAFAQIVAAQTPITVQVDTRLVRRYIRAVATIAGTSPVFPCSAVLIAQKERF